MATLKDVAKEAGLTVTTVSRVLNNRGYISEQARQKVYDAMSKLNYQPNEVARSLSKRSTDTIGLIVPNISHPYFSKLIDCLESAAEKEGYKLLLFNSNADIKLEEQYMDRCRASQVAGIILYSGRADNAFLSRMDVPVIALERYQENATGSIEVDNMTGGQLAARVLLESGAKHLIHISAVYEEYMPSDQREAGFQESCNQAGVDYKIVRTHANIALENHMKDLLMSVLKDHPDTDGLFTGSDLIAAQALMVCRELNLSVPEDIKIVGYDDLFITEYVSPALTTIHQPLDEISALAVEYIIKASKGKAIPRKTVLPVSLIKRSST